MKVVVCYDISTEDTAGRRRLRRVAKLCESFGQRVQYSIFECQVDPAQWLNLKSRLLKIMDNEDDSLRFYNLGKNWERKVEVYGKTRSFDMDKDTLIL